ncbi:MULTISPECIES: response regulator [Cupriavidus]|uniref:Response regulator receiver:Metal-dependent phosphohydrolase, HD subdomain protein n=1 Tax=Cupriavidus pinatubonensis (strain JMP 134 / LMG 1197) TaxID=264198 RepID=Q46TW0_CUPPJ|nr:MULTISPECIES: two-component system response regulator [Cupriavidus]QYY28837.1 two-component system response regulator [Cupriavidus pinatubonensis]TPQ37498.1 two-component system response regulator [Cupriavidus pinatubonensis]
MSADSPEQRPTVLVVDDIPENIAAMVAMLQDQYRVRVATRGAKALQLAASSAPDLILLDVSMPEMDGYETCRHLKANPATAHVPVIFLTARTDELDEARGFEVGAVDYIMKPVSPPVARARIASQLALKQAHDFLRDRSAYLEAEVQRRTREITQIEDATIIALAALAETRDNETGNHIRRTQHYVRALARALRDDPRFSAQLDDRTIDLLFKSAPLHDIGKVGIPDRILLKPGKLTAEEFEIMKSHTMLGRDAIADAEAQCGTRNSFLRYAREIAHYHHEKWDGTGYPEGLAGDDIPVAARLMALADVYDALISRRVYKPAFSHEESVRIIMEGRGRHFDPGMVDAFHSIADEFHAIALRFADPEHEPQRDLLPAI